MSATVVALAALTGACAGEPEGDRAVPAAAELAAAPIVQTTTTLPPTTTTALPPTTLPAKPIPAGLGRGARGAEVQALEQRLADLKYDVGAVDGVYDAATQHAVMAFQKVQSLPRSGRATGDVTELINRVGPPGPMLPGGGATRIEVDLKRQVLFLYQGGALHKIVSVSTGNGRRYCVDGQCATAVTPGGSFRITRRINGWRTSRLGKLYNPLYFNGGIAIHGAPSVPAYPASHGCVRIPMGTAAWFPAAAPNGTPVYVIGGPRAAVPFDEKAPGEETATTTTTAPTAPPAPSSTTTTSSPPPTYPPPTSTSTSTTLVPATTTTTAPSTTTTTTDGDAT